jgi:hypothetical protein
MGKKVDTPQAGDIVAIKLEAGFAYGQVCNDDTYAFFDFLSEELGGLSEVLSRPILFRVVVTRDAFKRGKWLLLGRAALPPELSESAVFWNQPVGSNDVFLIKGKSIIPATLDDVKGLEVMAAWHDIHIKRRLQEYFSGVENGLAARMNTVKKYDF